MTNQQIKNKIDDLTFWLDFNPNHPDYQFHEKRKIELEGKLADQELVKTTSRIRNINIKVKRVKTRKMI